MEILHLKKADEKILKDLNILLKQISESGYQMTLQFLQKLINDDRIFLAVALDGKKIVGMATLITAMSPTNVFGLIEEVVVDEKYRGQGLGENLMQYLIQEARRQNLAQLKLTSKKDRIAANELYKKLGFILKETNSYRMKLQ